MQQTNGSSNTGLKQGRKPGTFVKGDPRINRNGRPKSFDQARELAQQIAHELTTDANGNAITRVEKLIRNWTDSEEPALQKAFIEYAFGKVPDKLETTGLENKPVVFLHYAHERQSAGKN